MSESISEIINNGSVKLLVAAFTLGLIYSEFREVERTQSEILKELDRKASINRTDVIEKRLDKKIKVLNKIEDDLTYLKTCK